MYEKLKEMAEGLEEGMKECRRDLHIHAEQGWLEMRTSSIIARKMTDLGYEVIRGEAVCRPEARMGVPSKEALEAHYKWAQENGGDPEFLPGTREGYTGIVAVLHCGEGPTVGMRFDMDALPVYEDKNDTHLPTREGFCSMTDGTMHACGHDGHMTIGLYTAQILASIKDQLHGTIKFVFQPAEEGVRGARSIVESGILDDVDYMMGSHVSASDDGSCYVCPGMAGTFATTKLDAFISGRGAHAGATPNEGKNALLAAATAALNLQAIPRHGGGMSRVNVGVLNAGTGRNVVPDRASMQIEVRGETTEVNEYMEAYARRILKAASDMHECTLSVEQTGSAPAIVCSPDFTERMVKTCRDKIGLEVRTPKGMGGSEDYAWMCRRVIENGGKACFTGLHVPVAAPFHNRSFNFDERVLVMGTRLYTGMVWDLLGEEK